MKQMALDNNWNYTAKAAVCVYANPDLCRWTADTGRNHQVWNVHRAIFGLYDWYGVQSTCSPNFKQWKRGGQPIAHIVVD